jgi:hypothetical protein
MFPNRGSFRRSVTKAFANDLRGKMSGGGGGGEDKVSKIIGWVIFGIVALFWLLSKFN